ncbi:MAG: hypothetical protein WC909_01465 [Candidatus Paceibacterota bacterium]
MMFIIGMLFIFFSIMLMYHYFSQTEWRIPLLELSSEIEGGFLKKNRPGARFRGVSVSIFLLFLFMFGSVLVLRTPFLKSYYNIALIVLGIVLFWFLKGAYELFKASYSKKVRLLNYLYSPYLLVWRRDFLKEYNDYEIITAILKVCDIQDSHLLKEGLDLKSFLIELHKKTMPNDNQERYLKNLEDNFSQ